MLYLTIGYDWLLFGHMLTDRLRKGEEILLFCFDFLQFALDDEYAFEPSIMKPAPGLVSGPTAAAATTAGVDAEEARADEGGARGAAEPRAPPPGTPPGFGAGSIETHVLSPSRPNGDDILLSDSHGPEGVPGDSLCRLTDSVESRPQSILSDDEVGGRTSGSSVGSPERGDGHLISPPMPPHCDGAAVAVDLAAAMTAAARSFEVGSSDSEDDSSAVELDGLVILDDVKAGAGAGPSEAAPTRAPSGLRLACGQAQSNSDRVATAPPGPSVGSPPPLALNTTTNPLFRLGSGFMPMPGQVAVPAPTAQGLQLAGSPRSVPIAIPNSIGKSLERFDDGGTGSWQMLGDSCRSFGGYPAAKAPQGRARLSSSVSSPTGSDDEEEDDSFQDASTSIDLGESPGSFVSRRSGWLSTRQLVETTFLCQLPRCAVECTDLSAPPSVVLALTLLPRPPPHFSRSAVRVVRNGGGRCHDGTRIEGRFEAIVQTGRVDRRGCRRQPCSVYPAARRHDEACPPTAGDTQRVHVGLLGGGRLQGASRRLEQVDGWAFPRPDPPAPPEPEVLTPSPSSTAPPEHPLGGSERGRGAPLMFRQRGRPRRTGRR